MEQLAWSALLNALYYGNTHVGVGTVDSDAMVIKNWTWAASAPQPGTLPYGWKIALQTEPSGLPGMAPLPSSAVFGDLTSVQGIAGEGEGGVMPSGTPSEKCFGSHFIGVEEF